jgi:hypothetical protein
MTLACQPVRPWPAAPHHGRWTPMTDWLQASGSPMYYTAAGTNQGTRVYRVQVRP